MTGHIRARGKGVWQICLNLGTDLVTGERKRRFEMVNRREPDAQRG